MGGDQDVRMVPEGMTCWKRLVAKNVERRTADLAGGKRFKQIILDQMITARGVDDSRTLWQVLEEFGIQDALGRRRQR